MTTRKLKANRRHYKTRNQEKSECATSEMKTTNTCVLDYRKAWQQSDAATAPNAPNMNQKANADKR